MEQTMSKAEARRRMKLGSQWEFTWVHQGVAAKTQFREVVHVQSNAIAMAKDYYSVQQAKDKPHSNATWLYFDCKYDKVTVEGDTITFTNTNDNGEVTLQLIYKPFLGDINASTNIN
jgi:hypothetical protein